MPFELTDNTDKKLVEDIKTILEQASNHAISESNLATTQSLFSNRMAQIYHSSQLKKKSTEIESQCNDLLKEANNLMR